MFKEIPASKKSTSKRKLVYGVGINDADYITQPSIKGKQIVCPIYRAWRAMLERCYCDLFRVKNKSYEGCAVCSEWLIFSNFKIWMIEQNYHGMELDKDIIKAGNKVYHPDLCVFVTQEVNKLLTTKGIGQGVSFHKRDKVFVAQISKSSKVTHIGNYKTRHEAVKAYAKVKSDHVLSIALTQKDKRIMEGLILHSKIIAAIK